MQADNLIEFKDFGRILQYLCYNALNLYKCSLGQAFLIRIFKPYVKIVWYFAMQIIKLNIISEYLIYLMENWFEVLR